MSFEFAYARTADFEGGWANDPNDRCGKTMHGVTESTWLDYWRRRGTIPPRPIEQATSSQAKIVLNDDYWTRTFSPAAACLTRLIGDPCHAHSLHLRAAATLTNTADTTAFIFSASGDATSDTNTTRIKKLSHAPDAFSKLRTITRGA